MQGRNHVALALAVPLGAAYVAGSPLPASVLAWGGLIIGSLAPDIDGEGSVCYLGNFLPQHITPKPIVRLLNWFGRTISSFIRALFGHRAALHWPLWGLLLAYAGYHFGLDWLLWGGIGYVLHILGDSLTISGVPLFGPLSKNDISFLPMVTGKFTESALGYLLWLFVGWQIVLILPYNDWLMQLIQRFRPEILLQ